LKSSCSLFDNLDREPFHSSSYICCLVSGRVQPGAVPGAPKYLDDEEEEELVRWIEGCAQIGYAKSVKEVRAVVGAIVAALCCC